MPIGTGPLSGFDGRPCCSVSFSGYEGRPIGTGQLSGCGGRLAETDHLRAASEPGSSCETASDSRRRPACQFFRAPRVPQAARQVQTGG
jgi:hypothetical protein